MNKKTKVLIIDDSAIVRKILKSELNKEKDIEVVGTAPDPYIGRDKLVKLEPDVLLLDIEMPRMDGLTFLQKIMKHKPMPVIIISSLTKKNSELALTALELGAVDVISKPGGSYSVIEMRYELVKKIKDVSQIKRFTANIKNTDIIENKKLLTETTNKIIAIGASTGGTQAIRYLIKNFSANFPATLIVQHMPPGFTRTFAVSLNKETMMEVKEAEDGQYIYPGLALIAPGNKHMVLNISGARYYVTVKDGPLINHSRPSVDILFNSVAKNAGKNAIGVLLTGMGKDGAEGLLAMHEQNALTIAQDENSSIVFGMPKEAIKLGATKNIIPLQGIPKFLYRKIQ